MTNLLKLNYLFLALWLCVIHSAVTHAADLIFTPAVPIVEINQTMVLSVQGTVGSVKWITGEGQIQGDGPQVTYLAPSQAGLDVVTVLDSAGNVATVKIIITPFAMVSAENAQWEVFSNLDTMEDIAWVEGNKTFLVRTFGGLAQYEVETGELKHIFTQQEGLPDNQVTKFLEDKGGVWIGTANGLAYYSNSSEKLERYETPLRNILDLEFDGNGGIWVSFSVTLADVIEMKEGNKPGFPTDGSKPVAVAHLDPVNKQWTPYPLDTVAMQIVDDRHGGVWAITTNDGVNKEDEPFVLRHLLSNGEWVIYTAKALGLKGGFNLFSPEPDGQGGVWVAMTGHVVHFSLTGDWKIYNTTDAGLAEDAGISALSLNEDGTLSVAVGGMFFDLNQDGNWVPFPPKFPQGLSLEQIVYSAVDGRNGIWIVTTDRHLWHEDADKNWTLYPDTSNYPYSTPFSDNVPDGEGGVWVGTFGEGLVHLTKDGQWEKGATPSKLPLSNIFAIGYDNHGGGWILGVKMSMSVNYDLDTTMKLIHCTPKNLELICDSSVSDLPPEISPENTQLFTLLADDKDGLWLSSESVGLFYRNSEGQWTTYDTTNSELPNNTVWTIINDGNGGLWIGTDGGLAHLSQDQTWTIYTTSNSGLPDDNMFSLETDSAGGIWIGSGGGGGLTHLNNNGEWTSYTTDNSPLPNNNVSALLKGEDGGLWIGTAARGKSNGGLVNYLSETGEWTTCETELGSFPRFFISDQQGGIWVATLSSGLAHFSREGTPILFNSHNSGLPSDQLTSLLSDGQGGLWTSSLAGGLTHLTFSRQTEFCTQADIDAATCQAIQQAQHAAIIVAAGGTQQSNRLWDSTEAITNRLYNTFYRRGFAKSNIYYLSPKTWADFNGDGLNDRINRLQEDRHLTLDDLQAAFTWAKGLGKLDQPLYFFFMDHGGEDKLQLSPDLNLAAEELKTLLDDYQNTTGNQLIVVIEACHSGSLMPILAAPNRAVITSAKEDELAYFFEKKGFSRFFADYLLKGANFSEAFGLATRDQEKLLGKNLNLQTAGGTGLTSQTPQLDDNQDGTFTTLDGNWLTQVYINGPFTTADATLAVDNLTPATTLSVGTPATLQAKVTLAQGTVKRVWAVIRPPAIAQILDTSGTPILAFPRLNLSPSAETPDLWQATWNDAVYNGNYLLTFYAEDNEKNIASSELDTVLTVTGGIDPPQQAQVQIHLEKDRYQRGETFKATLTEDLGWGYDLYAAVLFPDGQNFMTLESTNELRPLNEAKPWYVQRTQGGVITLFDLTLPADLPTGQYCLFGILSPEQNDVFETLGKGLWVMDSKCLEIF